MWKDLTLEQKAEIMKMSVANGVTDINDIQQLYDGQIEHGFEEGGRVITIGELPEGFVEENEMLTVRDINNKTMSLKDAFTKSKGTHVNTEDVPGLTDYLIRQEYNGILPRRPKPKTDFASAYKQWKEDYPITSTVASLLPITGTIIDGLDLYTEPNLENAGWFAADIALDLIGARLLGKVAKGIGSGSKAVDTVAKSRWRAKAANKPYYYYRGPSTTSKNAFSPEEINMLSNAAGAAGSVIADVGLNTIQVEKDLNNKAFGGHKFDNAGELRVTMPEVSIYEPVRQTPPDFSQQALDELGYKYAYLSEIMDMPKEDILSMYNTEAYNRLDPLTKSAVDKMVADNSNDKFAVNVFKQLIPSSKIQPRVDQLKHNWRLANDREYRENFEASRKKLSNRDLAHSLEAATIANSSQLDEVLSFAGQRNDLVNQKMKKRETDRLVHNMFTLPTTKKDNEDSYNSEYIDILSQYGTATTRENINNMKAVMDYLNNPLIKRAIEEARTDSVKSKAIMGTLLQNMMTRDVNNYSQYIPFIDLDREYYGGGTPQDTYLLNRDLQREVFLNRGFTEVPGDYGLVRKAVGNRDIPVYQQNPDVISRDKIVPVGNLFIEGSPTGKDEKGYWLADKNKMLEHAANHPTVIYADTTGSKPTFFQKGYDLNDYANSQQGLFGIGADLVGSPTVVTTGIQRIDDINKVLQLANNKDFKPTKDWDRVYTKLLNQGNKHVLGGHLFDTGGSKNDYIDPNLSIYAALKKAGIEFNTSNPSGYRGPGHYVGKAREKSQHAQRRKDGTAWALDITGDFNKIRRQINASKPLQDYFAANSIVVSEELTKEALAKTGGTGPHFHIGRKSGHTHTSDPMLTAYDRIYGSSTPSIDYDAIYGQSTPWEIDWSNRQQEKTPIIQRPTEPMMAVMEREELPQNKAPEEDNFVQLPSFRLSSLQSQPVAAQQRHQLIEPVMQAAAAEAPSEVQSILSSPYIIFGRDLG